LHEPWLKEGKARIESDQTERDALRNDLKGGRKGKKRDGRQIQLSRKKRDPRLDRDVRKNALANHKGEVRGLTGRGTSQ